MFCPICGKADQLSETYCRQCGNYLNDYTKPAKKTVTPEQHLTANIVLSLLTAVTSLTLAILLYSIFLGKQDTPVIIYATAGFLTAMTAWQIQTFWRSLLLRKHFKKQKRETSNQLNTDPEQQFFESKPTRELLNEADLSNVVPLSVIENTTKKLNKVRNER
jgi:hypothetical protein